MAKRKASSDSPAKGKKAKVSSPYLSRNEIDELVKLIESDHKYNALVTLLTPYEAIFEALVKEDSPEIESDARYLSLQLAQAFQKLFENNMLIPKKSHDDKKKVVVKWLISKYESFKDYILKFLSSELDLETDLQLDLLDIYMMLIKLEAQHNLTKEQPYFPTSTYQKLVFVVLKAPESLNFISAEFQSKFASFWDLQFYFFHNLSEILISWKDDYEEEEDKETYLQEIVDRFLAITTNGDIQFNPTNVQDLDTLKEGRLPSVAYKPSSFKSDFQKCLLAILSFPLKASQYKHLLLYLHKRIIPYMAQPQSLMDFLTAAYDVQDDDVIPILALNSLYELMKRYNLEYPDFYSKLYALLTPSLLYTRYRSRFFRLCDLFLSSTHLSLALVASFIKRLARLALRATASGTVIVIPFVYNLMKRHPTCMALIHRPDFQTGEVADPFNESEQDPLKTGAINSSLWELETIMNHYHPNVATLAKIFAEPFRKPNYNMEDFLDWNYKTLLESEKKRKYRSVAALEFQEWDGAFEGDNSYMVGWSL